MKTNAFRLLPLILLVALGIAACGGSDDEASTSTEAASTESVIGGGTAMCDQATFAKWVEEYGKSQGTTATLADGDFACADGWAVLNPTIDDGNGGGIGETVIVQAEGPVWALMQRDKVCGADPAASEVPESLYQAACQTN